MVVKGVSRSPIFEVPPAAGHLHKAHQSLKGQIPWKNNNKQQKQQAQAAVWQFSSAAHQDWSVESSIICDYLRLFMNIAAETQADLPQPATKMWDEYYVLISIKIHIKGCVG
jgi:hypothetical protein